MPHDTCACGSGFTPRVYNRPANEIPPFTCEHCGADKSRERFEPIDGVHWAERWADERAEQEQNPDSDGFTTVWPPICTCGSGLYTNPLISKSGRTLFRACPDCWVERFTLFLFGKVMDSDDQG